MKPPIEDRFTILVREGKISRQRAYQLRHKEQGLCLKCGQPRVTRNHCLTHAVAERERQRRKLQAVEEHDSPTRKLQQAFVPPPLDKLAEG